MFLIVVNKTKVKAIRTALERLNFYDASRKIVKLSDSFPTGFALPVTPACCAEFESRQSSLPSPFEDCYLSDIELPLSRKHSATGILHSSLLEFLRECGCDVNDDEITRHTPTSWERHGDLVVLPAESFSNSYWKACLDLLSADQLSKFWSVVSRLLRCKRLAVGHSIASDGFRSSKVRLLVGEDGWVDHVDNGIHYVFDVTKCMFSSGNITEKLRVARFDCHGETVVDLYAGIGYFVFPYLVHAGAEMVHACEWNPHAVDALKKGLKANGVEDRCVVHFGDNRKAGVWNIADRVNVGLIPSSEEGWPVACNALNVVRGGWLHIHGNVTTSSELVAVKDDPSDYLERYSHLLSSKRLRCISVANWIGYVVGQVLSLLEKSASSSWTVQVQHVEHVKSYAPHVSHLVLDLECRPQR